MIGNDIHTWSNKARLGESFGILTKSHLLIMYRIRNKVASKMEKEFYSKLCVIESIKPVVDETTRNGTGLQMIERFSCNLATILARDKEVVAVRLTTSINSCTVYISKNKDWLKKDDEYIRKIKLRDILEVFLKMLP